MESFYFYTEDFFYKDQIQLLYCIMDMHVVKMSACRQSNLGQSLVSPQFCCTSTVTIMDYSILF